MSLINTHNLQPDIVNDTVQSLDSIKGIKSKKAQLQKVSTEFEAIFVTKMLTTMDKTVNSEGGIFGEESKYLDKFKSYVFQEMGRQMASNPNSSIGFAKQIYAQMEKSLPREQLNEQAASVSEVKGQQTRVDEEI